MHTIWTLTTVTCYHDEAQTNKYSRWGNPRNASSSMESNELAVNKLQRRQSKSLSSWTLKSSLSLKTKKTKKSFFLFLWESEQVILYYFSSAWDFNYSWVIMSVMSGHSESHPFHFKVQDNLFMDIFAWNVKRQVKYYPLTERCHYTFW